MNFRKSGQNEKIFLYNKKKASVVDHRSTSEIETIQEQEEGKNASDVGKFRAVFSQILAVSTVNLILLDLGMVLAFPTVVIPDLLKSTGDLKFTEEQASWFGSGALICQPLGSLLSGFLFEPVGRKKTMVYVNIPLLMGWLLIHFGTSTACLYVGAVIMGISIGFVDAPHITYLGEITQPKWRGILTSYAELCVALGFCFVYFLGTAANWRTVAGFCSLIPVSAMLLITQIPESPVWLLSKGRKKEAEQSLCWLRGWVNPELIEKEFSDLIRHNDARSADKSSNSEIIPLSSDNRQNLSFDKWVFHKTGIDCIFRRPVFQPLVLVVVYFGFSHVAGVTSTRPFMFDILNEFGTPLDANWVTAISSVTGIFGYIIGMIILPRTGKRLLSLISMFGCAITNGLMAIFGYFTYRLNVPLLLVSLFLLLHFMWNVGIGQIPWMLISEVFPFKGRGIASGISAALSYILAFTFTKTYYITHNSFTLPGVFGFYAVCTFFGGLYLYYYLPETEGKTLEQIESLMESHLNEKKQPDLLENKT